MQINSAETEKSFIENNNPLLFSKLRPFSCDICEMRFDEKTHLRQHIGHRHLPKDKKCPNCDVMVNNISLISHQQTHRKVIYSHFSSKSQKILNFYIFFLTETHLWEMRTIISNSKTSRSSHHQNLRFKHDTWSTWRCKSHEKIQMYRLHVSRTEWTSVKQTRPTRASFKKFGKIESLSNLQEIIQ